MNYDNAYNYINSLFFKDILNRIYLKEAAGPIGPMPNTTNIPIDHLKRGDIVAAKKMGAI